MDSLFKRKTRQQLIDAANAYSHLLGKIYVLDSPLFVNRHRYLIRFYSSNFLHLSGVETNLTANVFFNKCLHDNIEYEDFWDSPRKNKSTISKKLRNLVNVDSIFDNEVLVQENYVKNTIHCVIATTDGKCTMGFVDNKQYVVPNTILGNNHLDPNKSIYKLKAKVLYGLRQRKMDS